MQTRHRPKNVRSSSTPKRAVSVSSVSDQSSDLLCQRAQRLLTLEIRFVYSPDFSDRSRVEGAVAAAEQTLTELSVGCDQTAGARDAVARDFVPGHWCAAAPLLSFEQEQILFRAMNLVRFQANALRSALSADRPVLSTVDRIEALLAFANRIRAQLVNSNLRLVLSLARRFSAGHSDLDDFSSDGSLILLSAIDRFDFSRGYRFSTYATHSIQRQIFRALKVRQKKKSRFVNVSSDLASDVEQAVPEEPLCQDPEAVVTSLLARADEVLESREHRILMDRFGLRNGQREERTLREVAADMGISKERVRQLQTKALEKLRRLIDTERICPALSAAMAGS